MGRNWLEKEDTGAEQKAETKTARRRSGDEEEASEEETWLKEASRQGSRL